MKRVLTLALAGLLAVGLALPAFAGGSSDTKRDYDRGFFINLEGWYAAPESLPNEWAVVGTRVEEIDFSQDWALGGTVGASFGPRIGSFYLTYMTYDTDEDDAVASLGNVHSAVLYNELGAFDSGAAGEDIEFETWDFGWKKGFGGQRKFEGFWTVGLRYWEYRDTLAASFDPGAEDWVGSVDDDGFGVRMGVGGSYHFVPRFAIAGGIFTSFLQGNSDSYFVLNGVERRSESDDKTFTQFEGKLAFMWFPAGGLSLGAGYRYMEFLDAVDFPGGPGPTESVTFEGPFVAIGYNFGTRKVDTDGDTVLDYLDDCPGTPKGCTVDENGCPKDGDQDGVCDGVDKCVGTAFGCRVGADGCQTDEDADQVCDGLDLCPGTKFGCAVDSKGCHKDSDGDTVCDGMMDHCPNTPKGLQVDALGCPTDSDGDTVLDGRDMCPDTPKGARVNEDGCEIEIVLQNVQFDFNMAVVKPEYYGILDKLAKGMKENPDMNIRLNGHTDWIGTEEYNLELSDQRAAAVKAYLASKGIAADRMGTKGHGECCPVAPNTDDAGRYKNRRVEVERLK